MLWNSRLETGVRSIDDQHKELFRIVESALKIGKQENNKESLLESMEFLKRYVELHFTDEERLQKESNYPKASIHKMMHYKYMRDLQALINQYEQEGDTTSTMKSINNDVVVLLIKHILVHDKEFSVYYKEHIL